MLRRAPGPVLVAALATLAALRAHPEVGPSPEEWAVAAPLAARSLLLDAAVADGRVTWRPYRSLPGVAALTNGE